MTKSQLIALFCFITSISFAQYSPVRFKQISIDDGLSLSSVYCIHRDSKGFIWMGTEDGLNRFDGYEFKIFRSNIKNKNSICYKWIEHIYEDNQGFLWFGSRAGLSQYNPKTESFTNYNHLPNRSNSLLNDTITHLVQANDSLLLVGTSKGLNLIHIINQKVESASLHIGRTNDIKAVSSNSFLIGTNNGLYDFDLTTGKYIYLLEESTPQNLRINSVLITNEKIFVAGKQRLYTLDINSKALIHTQLFNNFKRDEFIESLLKDNNDRLWMSTNFGLYLYNENEQTISHLIEDEESSHSLATNPAKPITIDNHNVIWYGTHGSGLYSINSNLNINVHIHNPFDQASLSQNAINCIYTDTLSGDVWIGTFGAGVNIFNANTSKFDLIRHNPIEPNSLASDFIWSIFEASDNSIWIGTNDKGISRYIPSSNTFQFFDHNSNNKNSLSHSSVREIYEDTKGTIWVGTDGGGLNRYNPQQNNFIQYQNTPDDTTSLSNNSVRVIFEDSKHQLWVGTRNGLNLFNPGNQSFIRHMHDINDSTSLSNNFIYSSIFEDKEGYLWIGTYGGGLNRMNPENGSCKHYLMHGEKGKVLSNNIVFSIYEAENGLIWIGTNEGLNVLDRKDDSVKFYGTDDGLPNEVIYGILPDENRNLWLSTNHGISCFNPRTETFRNFDVHDGLQSNEFNGGAFHKGKNGHLYFGGVYGLNVINAKSIAQNTHVNQPIITKLEVLGKKVVVAESAGINEGIKLKNDSLMMDSHISYTDEIYLKYKQRFFSLEFTGLNHLYSNKTQYKYQLYPLDKEWHKAGKRNYVSYANVKPGKYTFRVKSTNIDGNWSKTPTELKIFIKPPFWLTYWFMALEALLALAIISFIYRFLLKIKTNKLLREQNTQINAANEKLIASESSLKQMNATKDKFFSIISHDLKNPFTGLMSISELLDENFDNFDKEDRRASVQKIHKSVKQIYTLLENLLTWSRSQRGTIDFKKNTFDLSTVINENINLYRLSADKKQVRIQLLANDKCKAIGDRDTINTVIRNLTNNAIKYSNPLGKIILRIDNDNNDFWKVSVSDTGVGILSENINRLFLIDQKIKTDGTSGEKGTGLGLIICKEFVEKNGGNIGIKSKVNEGSTFWFTVPKA